MQRIIRVLSAALTAISAFALLLMMLHVNSDVIGRYLFNKPTPLTMEMVSYYYMVAVAMLPVINLERQGRSLVHVELVYGLVPDGAKRLMHIFALAFAALFFIYAAYAAWKPAVMAYQYGAYTGSIVKVIVWPTRFLPVIGFSLLALVLVLKTIVLLRFGYKSDELSAPDGSDFENNEAL